MSLYIFWFTSERKLTGFIFVVSVDDLVVVVVLRVLLRGADGWTDVDVAHENAHDAPPLQVPRWRIVAVPAADNDPIARVVRGDDGTEGRMAMTAPRRGGSRG